MEQYDANDLLLFARVAEAGSFSRAAERIGLPKSTVSRRISLLEERLGERLLQVQERRAWAGALGHNAQPRLQVGAHPLPVLGDPHPLRREDLHRVAQATRIHPGGKSLTTLIFYFTDNLRRLP